MYDVVASNWCPCTGILSSIVNYAGCTSIHYYNAAIHFHFSAVCMCLFFLPLFLFSFLFVLSLSVLNYILCFWTHLQRCAQLLYNYRNMHKSFHSIFPLKCNRMFSTLSSDLNRLQWSKCTSKQSMRLNKTGCFIFISTIYSLPTYTNYFLSFDFEVYAVNSAKVSTWESIRFASRRDAIRSIRHDMPNWRSLIIFATICVLYYDFIAQVVR